MHKFLDVRSNNLNHLRGTLFRRCDDSSRKEKPVEYIKHTP